MAKVTGAGLSVPTVIEDAVIMWPPDLSTSGYQAGTAFVRAATACGLAGGSIGLTSLWAAPVGGGTAVMGLYNDVPVARLTTSGAGAATRTYTAPTLHFHIPVSATGLPNLGTASPWPRWNRVIRIVWLMRMAANNPTGGLLVHVCQAVGPAQTAYCFGVLGDGVGNYRWYTNRTAVAGVVTEQVALNISNPGFMHLFEMQIVGAVGTGVATCELFVDGSSILSRPFSAGGVLPLYSDGFANAMNYCVGIDPDDNSLVASAEVQYGPMQFIFSRYDRSGVLVEGAGG